MEYQKIINLLDNTSNQLTQFRTKNWVEINNDACGTYNTIRQIKFKTSILESSDAYILVKGNISIARAPFTDCINEINNTQIHNNKNIDVAIPMYNLIEYSNSYAKTSRMLWQYYRDKPVLTNADTITNISAADKSDLFKFKQKITGKTADCETKDVEIMMPLKCFSKFWKTLEIPLINCEINRILTCSCKCVIK